jgi:fructose/tagatose bisphosphate aldolase
VFVEGQIGTVSRTFESIGAIREPPKYTDLQEAVAYMEGSGNDSLAISIGSVSGLNKGNTTLILIVYDK